MNEMEEFLTFGAVVKIRKEYDDDLYKFIELMKSIGFLREYAESFEKNCCFDKEFNEFSEDRFWYYVKLNNGNTRDTCIEFQWSKGFTWGNRKFNMNYEKTSFQNELEDKESATELDDFLAFYEWSIVKYPDGKYNIKDEQCNTFDFEENTTFDTVLDRVYFRMFDYFIDEGEVENLIRDGEFNYVKKVYESYMKVGKNLKLLDDNDNSFYGKWFKELTKDIEEKEYKETIEISNNI